jgi:uncharacterized protein YukJ
MSIRNYSVVKGAPQNGSIQFDHEGRNPHYVVNLHGGECTLQVAINIESQDGSEVLYEIQDPLTPPDPKGLLDLPAGQSPIDSVAGGLAVDYVRSRVNGTLLVDRGSMTLLPITKKGETSNLQNAVVALLNRAVVERDGTFYAFGSYYEDPGRISGVHDIHMNQGNPPGNHNDDNGIWQDGSLFINLPSEDRWVGLFIAFQTESWQTDSKGNPQ